MSGINLMSDELPIYKAHIHKLAFLFNLIFCLLFFTIGDLGGLATTELLVTNKRVIGRRGLFIRKKVDVRHREIILVKVKSSVLGKLFNYGNVIIITKTGQKIAFKAIAHPDIVQQQIEELIEVAVLGHTLSAYTAERF